MRCAIGGVGVSSLACGLQPVNQWALQFYNRVAYHEFEGLALDLDERDRLIASLGDKRSLILRNYGLLTIGRTVAEAFLLMRNLERACRVQLAIQATGGSNAGMADPHAREWAAFKRHLEASTGEGYRD